MYCRCMNENLNDVIRNKERCVKILSFSPKIRYAGIINNFGRTIAGKLRKGVIPLLKTEEAINEHFIEATRNHLRRTFESKLGRTIYTITENEKVILITIPHLSEFYYVTFDVDIDPVELRSLIYKINSEV
jgi:hypothetical protein